MTKILIFSLIVASEFALAVPRPSLPDLGGDLVHEATLYKGRIRKGLKDDSAPWVAFGLLEGPGGFCSAQMVGPKVVLTAAHCLTAKDGSGLVKGSYIFKAFRRGNKFIASAKVKSVRVGTLDHKDYQNDWAVLLLEKDISHKTGYLGIAHSTRESLKELTQDDSIYFVAYMRDWMKGLHPTWQKACKFMDHVLGTLVHDCSTTYRSSGGAFITRNGTPGAVGTRLVGLNVGQYIDPAVGVENEHVFEPLFGNIAIPTEGFYDIVMEWRKY